MNKKLICGWCKKNFEATIEKNSKTGCRDILICKNCFRVLPSSKKELIENSHSVGKLHIHIEWKNGDIVS